MYGRAYFLIHLFMFYIYGQHVLLHKVELLTFNLDAKNKEDKTIEIKNTQMVTVSATHYDILNKRNDVIAPLDNNSNSEKQISKLIGELQNDNCLIIPYEKSALDWILALTNVKTIIYPKSHMLLMEKLRQFDTYIAIIRTIQDLKHFLTMLRATPNWTCKAKYLLIYLGSREVMEEIFQITWKYHLLDVSVVIQHRESFEVYTHFPYRNGSCGSNSMPVRLDDNSDIFPEKIDSDLKGCEIRMMAVKIPPYVLDVDQPKDDPTKVGLEVTILHNVLKKMNFTEIYVPTPYPSWGKMLSETNFTMAFKFLYAREVDIVFGMIITNASFLRVFESTVCHIRGNTVWAVPTASEIAQWKNLSVIFDGIVWASIFLVFMLNGFAWWIMGRNRESSSSYNELSLCLMGALYILLQGSFTTAKTWKLRLIVLLWSIASLLIYTAHQCQLTGILTSPLYDHQISSLKELVESDLHYGIHSELEVLYSDPNNPVHRVILNNHEECSLQMECLNRTAFKRDFATIKNERQIKYLMPISYTTARGKPMLYMFHENAVLYLCKYLMSEGFPFLKPMDRRIMLLQDSGLVAKWENDLAPKSTVNDDTELEPLTLNHLQAAFFLLLFGYIAASGIFLAEKCYERFGHKEKRVNVKDIPVLLGMSVEVHGRPVERTRRSAEDIIAGVDFLSVFIKSANDRSARNNSNKITTTPSTETTQASTDIDESTTFTNVDDNPTTIQNIDQQTETNKPVTIESSTDKSTTETIPVTLVSFETNTEIHETIKIRRGKNEGSEELKLESSKVILSVENPSAIVSEARKSDFSIDESEPIVLDTNHSPNDGVKFKTKPEDLVAIGANPDYIAQQNARIQGITNYNQPYGNRNPSSRGRSVSYSAAVQVLPHPHAAKSWKQEDESIRSTNRQRGNTPVSTSKDYDTNSDVDYDYTESYQDYNEKQNATKTQPISTNSRPGDAVAESNDFYVTRKYNPGDFNESGDKPNRNGKQEASNEKKHVEPTERNWGIPEKNYEIPESNHHTSPTVYARPEENYEIDETISVMTNGRAHGVQAKLDDKPLQIKVGQTPVKPDDNQKIGYVVEGRNYRKYRVEERTSDGFIVGEYGVVSNNDGSLRGVRYTADGTTNPRVIYDALMKFLSL